jgi:hypothetical protein
MPPRRAVFEADRRDGVPDVAMPKAYDVKTPKAAEMGEISNSSFLNAG